MPRRRPRPSAADWLSLSAAPVFALMALVTAIGGDTPSAPLCGEAGSAPFLGGMLSMYLLMTAVHLAPWIRLASPRPAEA